MHAGKVWTLYALDAPALRTWGQGRTLRAAMNHAINQAARRRSILREVARMKIDVHVHPARRLRLYHFGLRFLPPRAPRVSGGE